MSNPVHIVLGCADVLAPKIRYVFDTLFMARGLPIVYSVTPPSSGIWILYGNHKGLSSWPNERCLGIAHHPETWRFFDEKTDIEVSVNIEGLSTIFPQQVTEFNSLYDISFDLIANAFYFLCSWSERLKSDNNETRCLYANSLFKRLNIAQDIVDQYLQHILNLYDSLGERLGTGTRNPLALPNNAAYAVVLSHDVDFIPYGFFDIAKQGIKTVLRHLIRQRALDDAISSAFGLASALIRRRDPFGCIPFIIAEEKKLGVQASFQVAVGHRHPYDVNYRIEDESIRDYLTAIPDAGFDLCLHGSYRSTEKEEWYVEEAALLTHHLGKPIGSRQHFLSFDYDTLFRAQEQAGILYDMSMGYPDHTGSRNGFSFPYFPYCLAENRPFKVLEFSLFLMDVTLRSYMDLKGARAWDEIKTALDKLRLNQGCVSTVWHPIVFGGVRDPGYDDLFWKMIGYIKETGGLATDGRTLNEFWRTRASDYASFK